MNMKREILFRGKTNSGKWIFGNLVYSDNIQPAIYFEVGKGELKTFDWLYVDPNTVGQFTGLTDKNGVKIFEGDIIKVDIFSKPYLISFGKSEKWGACFCVKSHNSITFLTKNWSSTSEVIGNIHDNPELI